MRYIIILSLVFMFSCLPPDDHNPTYTRYKCKVECDNYSGILYEIGNVNDKWTDGYTGKFKNEDGQRIKFKRSNCIITYIKEYPNPVHGYKYVE